MVSCLRFPSDGILPLRYASNMCYSVENLIVDTRGVSTSHGSIIKFWHKEKRLVRFLSREYPHCKFYNSDYIEEPIPKFENMEVIDEPLFIMYDDFTKTAGHFFLDCFPRLWYYKYGGFDETMKIGLVYPYPSGEPPYNPRQLMDIRYGDKIRVLENDKVYFLKLAIVPGIFYWWNDKIIPKRFVNFIDWYFSEVVSEPESHRKFYLSRQDVDYRKVPGKETWERKILRNEQDLVDKLSSHGIVSKTLKPLSTNEFIRCFRNKEQIISVEGSGLNYAILADPKTEIVTIVHPRLNLFFEWFHQLRMYKDFKLKFIYPKIRIYDKNPAYPNTNSDWEILNMDEIVDQIVG